MMDWEKLTADVVEAATAAFSALMSEKSDERFYAFALYTDEFAETILPSANSIEGFDRVLRKRRETNPPQVAAYRWATAEWAYEAKHAALFGGIYRQLEKHRKTLPDTEEALASYRTSVHECMISALARMDESGFFAPGQGRENVVVFISSSDDDEAFDMENKSARRLNPEQVYLPFLERYARDDSRGS